FSVSLILVCSSVFVCELFCLFLEMSFSLADLMTVLFTSKLILDWGKSDRACLLSVVVFPLLVVSEILLELFLLVEFFKSLLSCLLSSFVSLYPRIYFSISVYTLLI